MRTALTAALLLSLAVAIPPAGADQFLVDFTGNDWTWPVANDLARPGNYYEYNARVGAANAAYLTLNTATTEYTVVLGYNVIAHYVNGRITINGDDKSTGTPSTFNLFGDCDPNTDRLSFTDGQIILDGNFTSFDIIFDTTTGDGNLAGETNWGAGSQLGNIPVGQRTGWTFGATGIRSGGTPCGYIWQVDGNCVLQEQVPVEHTTWGAIKAGSQVQIRH